MHAAAGLDAVLANHNAFLDEELFTPGDEPRRYAAVYNAAMVDWKRHELARLVDSCLHITYGKVKFTAAQTVGQVRRLQEAMPAHEFANPVVDGRLLRIPPAEVAALVRQARCGLCLSAEEGAMFASMEYLLSGIPVVSTPATGGRDAFADPAFWLTVPPDPAAVAAGVREMAARAVPPATIREVTLRRIREHRVRLRAAVSRMTGGEVELPRDPGDPRYRFNGRADEWLPSSRLRELLHL